MSEQSAGFGREIRLPNPQQPKHLKITKVQVVLGVAALMVSAVAAWAIAASILPTEGMKRDAAYEACLDDARAQLRDPESAQFEVENDPGVMKNKDGETVYTFEGIVRARNGFGGMNSNHMMCFANWDDEKDEASGNAAILDF